MRIIGITCGWQEDINKHFVHDEYVRAVQEVGGLPVLLPTQHKDKIREIYSRFDGFIFSGGNDVDPIYFGEEPYEGCGEVTPLRDEFELELAKLVLKGEKPALLICRGIQLVNIAAGGSIYQDLKGVTKLQHNQNAPRWYPTHEVDIIEDSKLFQIVNKTNFRVNTFHHQSIKGVGKGLRVVGKSKDGVIEAIEALDTAQSIIGVQWHPECMHHRDELSLRVFEFLTGNGDKYGGRKTS